MFSLIKNDSRFIEIEYDLRFLKDRAFLHNWNRVGVESLLLADVKPIMSPNSFSATRTYFVLSAICCVQHCVFCS